MRGFRRRQRLWRDKQPWSLAARWCRAVRSLRNLGNLRNLPLTALQSGVCLRSRVTLTAFGISRTSASASSSARLRVQSFVLSLNSLSSLNSLLFVMPSHTPFGFAVTSQQLVHRPAAYAGYPPYHCAIGLADYTLSSLFSLISFL